VYLAVRATMASPHGPSPPAAARTGGSVGGTRPTLSTDVNPNGPYAFAIPDDMVNDTTDLPMLVKWCTQRHVPVPEHPTVEGLRRELRVFNESAKRVWAANMAHTLQLLHAQLAQDDRPHLLPFQKLLFPRKTEGGGPPSGAPGAE